jgi:hypothetical protein
MPGTLSAQTGYRLRALRSCFFVMSGEITTNPSARRVARPRVTSRFVTTGQRLQRGLLLQQARFGLMSSFIREA